MFKQPISMYAFTAVFLALSACSSEAPPPVSPANNTNMQKTFLPVEQAFEYSVKVVDGETVQAQWNIADGYHLYKDKINFEVTSDNFQIAAVDYPPSLMLDDKTFGNMASYTGQLAVTIKLSRTAAGDMVNLKSGYQGCAKEGLCYPPQKSEIELDLSKI